MSVAQRDDDKITAKQISCIQTLRSKIKSLVDDDNWRDWLEERTKCRSPKNLTRRQAGRVIDLLKGGKATQPEADAASGMATPAQINRVREIWGELRLLGAVKDPSATALLSYVKKVTKVEQLPWLSVKQIQSVIEQLKKWKARVENEQSKTAR